MICSPSIPLKARSRGNRRLLYLLMAQRAFIEHGFAKVLPKALALLGTKKSPVGDAVLDAFPSPSSMP